MRLIHSSVTLRCDMSEASSNPQSKYENNLKYNEDYLGSNVIAVPNGQHESHPLICQDQHFSLLRYTGRYPELISEYHSKWYK